MLNTTRQCCLRTVAHAWKFRVGTGLLMLVLGFHPGSVTRAQPVSGGDVTGPGVRLPVGFSVPADA